MRSEAGGRVHALIGNHEAFNMVVIFDYTTPDEFRSYLDSESEKLGSEPSRPSIARPRMRLGQPIAHRLPWKKSERTWPNNTPPGYFGHRRAFRIGRPLRELDTRPQGAIRLNGIVFSHGDWSEEVSLLGIGESKTRNPRKSCVRTRLSRTAFCSTSRDLCRPRSLGVPLTRAEQTAQEQRVEQILTNLEAQRMVVVIPSPRESSSRASVQAHQHRYRNARDLRRRSPVALEIQDGVLSAIHPGGKLALPDSLDETNFVTYLAEVAAVDENNLNVHARLAELYWEQGDMGSGAPYVGGSSSAFPSQCLFATIRPWVTFTPSSRWTRKRASSTYSISMA